MVNAGCTNYAVQKEENEMGYYSLIKSNLSNLFRKKPYCVNCGKSLITELGSFSFEPIDTAEAQFKITVTCKKCKTQNYILGYDTIQFVTLPIDSKVEDKEEEDEEDIEEYEKGTTWWK